MVTAEALAALNEARPDLGQLIAGEIQRRRQCVLETSIQEVAELMASLSKEAGRLYTNGAITKRQAEALTAWERMGTVKGVASELGVRESAAHQLLAGSGAIETQPSEKRRQVLARLRAGAVPRELELAGIEWVTVYEAVEDYAAELLPAASRVELPQSKKVGQRISGLSSRRAQRESLSLESSAQQLQRQQAIVERLKPGSRSQDQLIECMLNQLAAVKELHRLADREPLLAGEVGRLLWLAHNQVDRLQKSLSALVIEQKADPDFDDEETAEIPIEELGLDDETHPALRVQLLKEPK